MKELLVLLLVLVVTANGGRPYNQGGHSVGPQKFVKDKFSGHYRPVSGSPFRPGGGPPPHAAASHIHGQSGFQQGGFPSHHQGGFPSHQNNFQQGGFPSHQGGFQSHQTGFPSQQGGFTSHQGGFPSHQGGFPSHQGGFPSHQGGFPSHQGGFPSHQGGFPSHQGGFGGDVPTIPLPNRPNVGIAEVGSNIDISQFARHKPGAENKGSG